MENRRQAGLAFIFGGIVSVVHSLCTLLSLISQRKRNTRTRRAHKEHNEENLFVLCNLPCIRNHRQSRPMISFCFGKSCSRFSLSAISKSRKSNPGDTVQPASVNFVPGAASEANQTPARTTN